ncbi:hypothetical protein Bca52824_001743 [Brassica carinata]|uniref:Uncharacterized protein n=1 Tax=Brassica carinata TaxID=52824 RepID=A0A8X8BDN2_BRACI|nr:hypothetical protein Bca52824_001743 [Brassica carinata]
MGSDRERDGRDGDEGRRPAPCEVPPGCVTSVQRAPGRPADTPGVGECAHGMSQPASSVPPAPGEITPEMVTVQRAPGARRVHGPWCSVSVPPAPGEDTRHQASQRPACRPAWASALALSQPASSVQRPWRAILDTCLLCNVKNGGKIMDMDMLLIDEEFFLYVAELNAESKQRVKWGLTRRITNNNLEAADLDEDGVVGAVEFIVYKLKEMGKIDEKDISGIMEEFEQLDYDDSGTLTTSDIVLAQTTSQI